MENKNHLFRIAMAMAIMAFTILSSAQTSNNVLQQGKMKVWRDSPKQELNFSANISNQHRAKSQMVNVTIQMEYDASTCSAPYNVKFFNTENFWGFTGYKHSITRNWQTGIYSGQIPIGCYDIETEFISNVHESTYIVIHELVDIQSDTTIVIDQSTATNHMEIISKRPDGVVFDPNIYDDSGQITYQGNIDHGFFMNNIIRKSDFNEIYGGLGLVCYENLYINELSDRFFYENLRIFEDEEQSIDYYISYASMNFQFPLENDLADWEYTEETFQPSAIGKGEHEALGVTIERAYNGLGRSLGASAFTEVTNETVKNYYNLPKRNDGYSIWFKPMYGHGEELITNYVDYNGNIVFSDTTVEYYMIYGAPTIVENGAKSYINNGPIADRRADLRLFGFHNEDGLVAEHTYPGNPAFAFTEAEKTSNFGSGTPICLFVYNNWNNESPNWQFTYIGRYGEVREVDRLKVDLNLSVNGDEVCNGINQFNEYLYNPERPSGEVDITMSNDNVDVDGLPGKNFAQMHIDETKEDKDGPSLTMLWFKNAEGKITDRFAKSQDGILEFSAGDFNTMYDADVSAYTWFDCQKPDVEVSYAPYGEKSWNELEVEEVPENFYMPCFGHFYRGSLAGVTGQALKGWFDLKVKLTDAAGNWQEQVISPAFRIDQPYTGISDINSENAHEVARYNLAGQRVDANSPGVVIVRYSDGTARKMIVK